MGLPGCAISTSVPEGQLASCAVSHAQDVLSELHRCKQGMLLWPVSLQVLMCYIWRLGPVHSCLSGTRLAGLRCSLRQLPTRLCRVHMTDHPVSANYVAACPCFHAAQAYMLTKQLLTKLHVCQAGGIPLHIPMPHTP